MAKIGTRDDAHEQFWDIAAPYLEAGALIEGTMMGHQCLRASSNDGFVATIERSTGNLVVKLPKDRVSELIESGTGLPFAPAKKVFREWVACAKFDAEQWTALIEESIDFVTT